MTEHVHNWARLGHDSNTIAEFRLCIICKQRQVRAIPLEGGENMDTFRIDYTPLSEEQKDQVKKVKLKAQELWDLVESFVPSQERSERARLVNIGKTDVEKGVAMIVKGITTQAE